MQHPRTDTALMNAAGHTPLHEAAYHGSSAIVQKLTSYATDSRRVDPNLTSYYTLSTPLHLAAARGVPGPLQKSYVCVVRQLMQTPGTSLFQQDAWGHIPLETAIFHGSIEVVRELQRCRCAPKTFGVHSLLSEVAAKLARLSDKGAAPGSSSQDVAVANCSAGLRSSESPSSTSS